MTSSLCIKNEKFDDFLTDIDFNSNTDLFGDVISIIIIQCQSRRPKRASSGNKMSANRAMEASEARLLVHKFE